LLPEGSLDCSFEPFTALFLLQIDQTIETRFYAVNLERNFFEISGAEEALESTDYCIGLLFLALDLFL
jgi:hypothetical protein